MKTNKLSIDLALMSSDGTQAVDCRLYNKDADNNIQLPRVEYAWVGQRGIDDYKERKRKDVVDGYSIKVAGSVIHNVFILKDGTHEHEHLFTDLLELAGNATQASSFLRGAVQSAQGFAHTVKNYCETYKNFFGPLTADHLDWMAANLPSFEQALAESRTKAKTKPTEENEG